MNPGIFYLYEYKHNLRLRNMGFLKLSKTFHSCSVQLRARTIPVTRQDTLVLSAFYSKQDTLFIKTIANIPCNAQSFAAHLTFPESSLPPSGLLEEVDGFLIRLPNGNYLAAITPDVVLNLQNIQNYEEPSEPDETVVSAAAVRTDSVVLSESAEPDTPLKSPESTVPLTPGKSITPDKPVNSTDSSKLTCPDELSESSKPNELCKPTTPSTRNESTRLNEPDELTEPTESATPMPRKSIRKISRQDLSSLPRKCWSLSNNSFLLHGYYNYNHLLLIEENGHFWLGVPGIYDSREARAAELFGFPQFNDAYNKQLDLSEDEYNPHGKFGYWFHYIY